MKCYRCGSFLYESDYCSACGTDVSVYKKIVKKSNQLYNQGLGYARDRNLSRAIQCLEISIRMYKGNINARNLLGLIYIEIGEYTKGLAQWVISKSMQNEDNLADDFLDKLQNTKQDLDMMNTTIRKYNKVIRYVGQKNYDLAEIQLKKLLNDNPHLVKGHQLLALLLIRKKKYTEARAALRKAEKIDEGNPVTISYMTMVEQEIRAEEKELSPNELRTKRIAERTQKGDHAPLSGDDVIIPKSSYREYNPTTMAIIQIIIGLLIGAAIIFFIVMPAKTRALRTEAANTQAEMQAKIDGLLTQLEGRTEGETKETTPAPETLPASAQDNYNHLLEALEARAADDMDACEAALALITDTSGMDETFMKQYNALRSEIDAGAIQEQVNAGVAAYNNADYNGAINELLAAYDAGGRTEDLLYYLGRAYDYLSDGPNTVLYLQEYQDLYPQGAQIETVNSIVRGWGY